MRRSTRHVPISICRNDCEAAALSGVAAFSRCDESLSLCQLLQEESTPLKVLAASDVLSDGAEFRRLVQDWEVEQLLCGLPYTLSGEEGPQAASIKEKASRIARARNLPLFFADERMSSREAKRILREEGLDERAMRGKVDMIAASLFLQAWLDARFEHEDK